MTNIEQVTNRHIAKLMCAIEEGTGMDDGEVTHDIIAKNVRREMHRLTQDIEECFNPLLIDKSPLLFHARSIPHHCDNVIDAEIPLIPEGLKR